MRVSQPLRMVPMTGVPSSQTLSGFSQLLRAGLAGAADQNHTIRIAAQ